MVTARAWCRVDLAGGTLDIWPLGLLHPGACTVNVAIDLAATVRLQRATRYVVRQGESVVEAGSAEELCPRNESALVGFVAKALNLPPIEVEIASGSPQGAGLGGSSAVVVALIAAAEEEFDLPRSKPVAKARLARDLEACHMKLPTGIQDHYPGLLGGALEIRPVPGGEQVRKLNVDLSSLGDSLLVVYSGASHFSAGNNWQVVRRRLDGEAEIFGLFEGIAKAASDLAPVLEAGDLPRVGKLMSQEWSYRRQLAEGISTPLLENLVERALALGAWGGKACGAGGGGCLAFLCPPDRKAEIGQALEELGGRVLKTRPTAEPLQVGRG